MYINVKYLNLIVLITALLLCAYKPALAAAGSQVDEEIHFDELCGFFQNPAKIDQFDLEANDFLQKYPNSNFKDRSEYMLALYQFEKSGSVSLFDKIGMNKEIYPLLSASSLLIASQNSLADKDYKKTEEYFKYLLWRTDYNSYFAREVEYGRAVIEIGGGKWDKAGKRMKELNEGHPFYARQDKIIYTDGYILFKQGKYSAACDKFKVLNSTAALYYQAKCLEKLNKYIPAAIVYKQLLTLHPDISFKDKTQYSVAECFYLSTDYVSALAEYNSFIHLFPASPWTVSARYKIACCYYNLKDYKKAAEIFAVILRDSPSSGLAPCAEYMSGESELAQGNTEGALAYYQELVNKFGDSLSARNGYYKIGWCYMLNNDSKRAIDALTELVSKYPEDSHVPYALFLIGENYRKDNDIDKSIQFYQQVINYPGCSPDLLDAAVFIVVKTFYEQKKYDAIVSNFHYIINSIPEHRSEMNPYTHFLMAEAYYYLGLYTEANKNYDNVISTYPFGVPSSFSREGKAWSLFQSENYKGAMKQRELLRDDWMVTHSEAARIANEFETGDIYFNQKKYTEALDVFERFMADNPTSDKIPEATFNAGRCYYKLAYYSKAIELWDRLVANYKGTQYAKEAQSLIADTYFRMQKYGQARQASLNIITEYPGTELADKSQLRIAQCCYNAMDDKQAVAEFEKCLATSKNEETRDAAFEGILASAYRLSDAEPDSDYDIKLLEKNIADYPASKHAAAMQYRVAERYYERKDYTKAADEFRKVVSDFASSDKAADAMFYCAESLYHDAKYEDAAAAYSRFIDNYPKNDSIRIGYLHMANSLFYLEKFKEASEKYRELTAIGKQEDEIVFTAYFNASLCFKKFDNWDSVISINKRFVNRFPNNPRAKDALIEIANAYEILSNNEKAIEAYQDLYKVLPATDTMKAEVQYKIGKFYLKIGDEKSVKAAWEEFPKLLALAPPDDPWRLSGIAQLAQEYENRKDWQQALKMYQEILNSTKEPKWVSAAQERIEAINKEWKESQETKAKAK